jgi:hypothetical protein
MADPRVTDVLVNVAVLAGLKGLGVATARSRAGPSPGVAP